MKVLGLTCHLQQLTCYFYVLIVIVVVWLGLYMAELAKWEAASSLARSLGMHYVSSKWIGTHIVTHIWEYFQQMVFSGYNSAIPNMVNYMTDHAP